jgi:hypothetical protein
VRGALSASRLRHANIVPIYDVGEHEGQPFVAMEYIEGETLGTIVRGRRTMAIDRKLQWIEDLCAGLACAHRLGLVHRDVRPSNVMIDSASVVKIVDVGFASIGEPASTERSAAILRATVHYMAPEQVVGGAIDHRSDIFAVGAVAYELLSYRRPFEGRTVGDIVHRIVHDQPPRLSTLVPDIDGALAQIVERALAKDRERRYQDLEAMRADVAQVRQRLRRAHADAADRAGTGLNDLLSERPDDAIEQPPSRRAPEPPRRMSQDVVRLALQKRREKQIQEALERARAHLDIGAYEHALAASEEALLFDPDDPRIVALHEEVRRAIDDIETQCEVPRLPQNDERRREERAAQREEDRRAAAEAERRRQEERLRNEEEQRHRDAVEASRRRQEEERERTRALEAERRRLEAERQRSSEEEHARLVSEAELRRRQEEERQRAEIERRAEVARRAEIERRAEAERRAAAEAERQEERRRRMEEEERSWAELGRRVEDAQPRGPNKTHPDVDASTGRVDTTKPADPPSGAIDITTPEASAPPAPIPQPSDPWGDLDLTAPPAAPGPSPPQRPPHVPDVSAPTTVAVSLPIGLPREPRHPMATPPPKSAPRSSGSPFASAVWHTITSPFKLLGRLPSAMRRSPEPQLEPSPPRTTQALEPVLLGASAPRCVRVGDPFVVRFVAYVEHVEAHVTRQLRELDPVKRPDERTITTGLPTTRGGRWIVGAPVTVRLTGNGLTGDGSTASFEWNGKYNLVSFTVSVAPATTVSQVHLSVEAFIEGVPVGGVPLALDVADRASEAPRVTSVRRPFSTAFASYASKDAPMVSLCLSALHRWDPDVDVFMDCLDLTPNEDWKRELQSIIPTKDAFLLFWSANARQSPWVAWEMSIAAASRGLESIVPMPLEDPTVAPPPDQLKHLHFRDRYLIAHQALSTAARLERQRHRAP